MLRLIEKGVLVGVEIRLYDVGDGIAVRGFTLTAPLPARQRTPGIGPRECAVYRFYDDDGTLLYVGISRNPLKRWQAHRRTKPWWPDVARSVIDVYQSEAVALRIERERIRCERPLWNVRSAAA